MAIQFRFVSMKASRLSCKVTKGIGPTGVLNRRERMRWPLNRNKRAAAASPTICRRKRING